MWIPRRAERTLRQVAEGYPVVALSGPRQSGKTTLSRVVFPDKPYVSLEDPDEREFATDDPRGFLARLPDGAVIDEVQRCPAILSYLQTRVDQDRRCGLFVLTGSSQMPLMTGIAQSLAGRVALVPLLPFTLGELAAVGRRPPSLDDLLFRGLYPPLHDRDLEAHRWYGNYVATYLERDVRQMVNVRDLAAFQRFLRMCAGRTGQLLNLSALAGDCGITHTTARTWLSVLEASFVVHLLPPHHRNFDKRLVKAPKLYVLDTGLAAWLLGIQAAQQLVLHPLRGALMESWVVGEALKARYNRGLSANAFFWRDRAGHEVDILLDRGDRLVPVEVKAGQTVTGEAVAALDRWRALAGDGAGTGWLVYGGQGAQRRGGCEVVPWTALGDPDFALFAE